MVAVQLSLLHQLSADVTNNSNITLYTLHTYITLYTLHTYITLYTLYTLYLIYF